MLTVDIKKKLGDFQLDVHFSTDREILALLGASGCGKSMTLKCVAGIVKPDEGHIELNGRVLFDSRQKIDLSPQERKVGYLFQQYALFPNMTVEQNIASALRNLPREQRAAEVAEKIAAFHLEGLEKHRPAQLSGGQQQRVALARILASKPEVLLLDEPFSALDSYLKWQVELEMMDVLKEFDGDTLFVSHSRDEVMRLCDSVCVLTRGKNDAVEPVRQLMDAPGTMGAALISGCKNYSRAEKKDDHTVLCTDWGVTLTAAETIGPDVTFVGARAHYITFEDIGINRIDCRVDRVVNDTFSTIVMAETPGGKTGYSLIRLEVEPELWTAMGDPQEISIWIPPECLLLLRGE
ncbi:MAG: ATP-binding cassette domain-containing protein [Lachnospiraceae bacterium]|nr:ATP-binding cassette domain-containing protein [Lachnospiraceae bacterium]